MKEAWNGALKSSLEYLERSIDCLTPADGDYRPTDDAMTATQQLAHVAFTIDWFVDGAFAPGGFDMDFEQHMRDAMSVPSLEDAKARVRESYGRALAKIESASVEEWQQPLPAGEVLPGMPRHMIVAGIVEHTAHHRGALTVYSRLCGRTPAMPYA